MLSWLAAGACWLSGVVVSALVCSALYTARLNRLAAQVERNHAEELRRLKFIKFQLTLLDSRLGKDVSAPGERRGLRHRV